MVHRIIFIPWGLMKYHESFVKSSSYDGEGVNREGLLIRLIDGRYYKSALCHSIIHHFELLHTHSYGCESVGCLGLLDDAHNDYLQCSSSPLSSI